MQPPKGIQQERRAGNEDGAPWSAVLQLLGAAAGLTALTAFVGGAILWIRFNKLHLPADQAVNLLPKQLLLVVGAHALMTAILLGLSAGLAVLLIDPGPSAKGLRFVLLAVLVVPFALVAGALVWNFDVWPEQAVMVAAAAIAVVTIVTVALKNARESRLAWVVFASFALCGAVLAVVRTSGDPRMEPVGILLKGRPHSVGGFYIGQTADRLYIAPLPGSGDPGDPFADAAIDRILEVKRDQVRQMALRAPVGIGADEAGREEAQSLVEDLRVLAAKHLQIRAPVITTADPVRAFAPRVSLHVNELWWPMRVGDFLHHSWLAWAHDHDCADWSASAGRVVENLADRPELMGRFDSSRLGGPSAYRHGAEDRRCRPESPQDVSAAMHTRPYDARGRPRGLNPHEGFYLDLRNENRHGLTSGKHDQGPQAVFTGVPVYYEQTEEKVGRRRGLRITYWFFYGLSQPPGPSLVTRLLEHEGDWERISVLLARGRKADRYRPVSVRYYTHDEHRDVTWPAVRRVGTGVSSRLTHPVVFSARGSHASFWRAGRYENVYRAGGRRRFAVYDDAIACPDCPQWDTWNSLVDAQAQPWYGFGGAWGAVGSMSGTTGPLGPSPYKTHGLGRNPTTTVRQAPAPVSTPER